MVLQSVVAQRTIEAPPPSPPPPQETTTMTRHVHFIALIYRSLRRRQALPRTCDVATFLVNNAEVNADQFYAAIEKARLADRYRGARVHQEALKPSMKRPRHQQKPMSPVKAPDGRGAQPHHPPQGTPQCPSRISVTAPPAMFSPRTIRQFWETAATNLRGPRGQRGTRRSGRAPNSAQCWASKATSTATFNLSRDPA